MRKISIIVGQEGITLVGDVSEVSSQLIASGWVRREGNYHKDTATMDEVKHIFRVFGDPSSVNEHIEKNVSMRDDVRGNIVVEGDTSSIKEQLRTAGGLWSPRSHTWTFQSSSREAVGTLVRDLLNTNLSDTRVIDLSWNVAISPVRFGGSPILSSSTNDLTDSQPASPPLRRYSGEIPTVSLSQAIERDKSGKIISVSGVPVPGITGDSNLLCGLCGARGHTRMDCICPFCRFINLHNPRDCSSRDAK